MAEAAEFEETFRGGRHIAFRVVGGCVGSAE